MWRFCDNHIAYDDDENDHFVFSILDPDWSSFEGVVIGLNPSGISYRGYDDWVGHFSRENEISLIEEALSQAKTSRVHLRGISTLEGIEKIRDYYRQKGYEDMLAKNYSLPPKEHLTVSVSLGHALWCEKDKALLSRKHDKYALGHYAPPFRTPADLRSIQQALRMGVIMGIECPSLQEFFLSELLTKQILPAYQIGQVFSTHWGYHGFKGSIRDVSLSFPIFSEAYSHD